MITLKQFIAGLDTIPVMTSWYLADISEAKGRSFIKGSSRGAVNKIKPPA